MTTPGRSSPTTSGSLQQARVTRVIPHQQGAFTEGASVLLSSASAHKVIPTAGSLHQGCVSIPFNRVGHPPAPKPSAASGSLQQARPDGQHPHQQGAVNHSRCHTTSTSNPREELPPWTRHQPRQPRHSPGRNGHSAHGTPATASCVSICCAIGCGARTTRSASTKSSTGFNTSPPGHHRPGATWWKRPWTPVRRPAGTIAPPPHTPRGQRRTASVVSTRPGGTTLRPRGGGFARKRHSTSTRSPGTRHKGTSPRQHNAQLPHQDDRASQGASNRHQPRHPSCQSEGRSMFIPKKG